MPKNSRLFSDLNIPYYIYAPPYREDSGGVRALHYLCHALNLIGEEAYIVPGDTIPILRTPRLTQAIKDDHLRNGRHAIGVYPEVIADNSLGTRTVVRYLLNFPGHLTGVAPQWDASDLIYTHGIDVVPPGMHAGLLQTPLVNTRIFNKIGVDDSKRKGKLLWISRYIDRGGKLDPLVEDATEISVRAGLRTPQQLAELYRSAEVLYTYEPATSCYEALMCGCPVVYLPNDILLQRPLLNYLTDAGSAWGPEPEKLAAARQSLATIPAIYADLERQFWGELETFVQHTQEYARSRETHQAPPQRLAVPMAQSTPVQRKKRLLVFSAESPLSPCPQIRLLRPFAHLAKDWELILGIKDGRLQTEGLERADAILLHRFTPGLLPISDLETIFNLGKPVIYETDDLLNEMPDYHPQGGAAWKKGIEYTVRRASALVVSTPYLADKYRSMNPAVHILPNYVDFDAFYRPVPQHRDGQITIGLLGTSIQSPNFDLVDAALRAACDKYGKRIKIYFVGWAPPQGWEHHPNAEFVPVIVEYQNYISRLGQMQWDIALVPLAVDDFNLSKSPIKWLEYSAAGIATIFSNVSIYSDVVADGLTGLLADDSPDAWTRALFSLIDKPETRQQIAVTAQATVRANYSLERNAPLYGGVYTELLNGKNHAVAALAAASAPVPAPTAKKRLVVFSVESTWSPCPQIRFILPFSFLEAEWELIWGIKDGRLDTGALDGADLILLHRFTPGLFPQNDLESIFALGKPVIYETDDLLNDIPDYHPQAADSRKWKPGIEYTVQHARAVVVSTPFLADKYRAMNTNVHVLPNYLDFDRFFRPVPQRSDGMVTIGLLGTSIQGPNFALVDNALRTICERFPGRIKLYFVGWAPPAGWEEHPAVEFLPFIHEYQNYAARLLEMQWDIALVPLVNDDFNHSKSAIKWLEYAAAGIAPVFSDVSVYSNVVQDGVTGLLVEENPDAWLQAITALVEDPAQRHAIATAAQAEIHANYSLKEKSALYAHTYGRFAVGDFASEEAPATVPAVLVLDRNGDMSAVVASLQSAAQSRFAGVTTIVLTSTAEALPEWTEELRFVKVGADEFDGAVEQLSVHPDFTWLATVVAGDTL
jgi:glycosyltransferase involved in cell wall biosynthesis